MAETIYGPRDITPIFESNLLCVENQKQLITFKNGDINDKNVVIISVFRDRWSKDLLQMVKAKQSVELTLDELKQLVTVITKDSHVLLESYK